MIVPEEAGSATNGFCVGTVVVTGIERTVLWGRNEIPTLTKNVGKRKTAATFNY